ncbi:MAG: APC family permease [Candidatus Obscuribacterales bacterium]|nr:APC family permease [Candidatus Obscuribacterales bacterium]
MATEDKFDSQSGLTIESLEGDVEERKVPLRLLRSLIYGAPLATNKDEDLNRLPKLLALPVFCSDAISSVAYGPQQILLALTMAGLFGAQFASTYTHHVMEISWCIFTVLVLVSLSYWQTIFAYPGGGGSYIVTKDNLGEKAGLFAAAALLIDYVLCVSVSVASGLQNLKDVPVLHGLHIGEHLVLYAIGAILFMTWLNVRGLREPGLLFAIPFYTFILMSYVLIGVGLLAPVLHFPLHAEFANQVVPKDMQSMVLPSAFGAAVLLRAFATGCSALTGVECVSNGIPAFKQPQSKNAAQTLIFMSLLLGSVFIGIALLSVKLHIVYWEHDGLTAPAVIDQLSGTVFGKEGPTSIFYNIMQFSTALILLVAAQTSFADFPRVTSILAKDGYMPRQMGNLGDRLAFDNGIIVLSVISILFIIAEKGSVDLLIPFFTIGVFQAFSLSQIGMVKHWFKLRSPGWQVKALLNGLGALATITVFADIVFEKFLDGAWFVIILIGVLLFIFNTIYNHYKTLTDSLALPPTGQDGVVDAKTVVLVLVQGVHAGTVASLRYAQSISDAPQAVYVEIEPEARDAFVQKFKTRFPKVPLVILPSPYRSLVHPLLLYIDKLEKTDPQTIITVIIGEFVSDKWWHPLLHGNTGLMLKLALLSRPDIVVTNVRYRVSSESKATV